MSWVDDKREVERRIAELDRREVKLCEELEGVRDVRRQLRRLYRRLK